MSWNLWKKSGECCWVKAAILWSCSLTSESHISLRVYSHGSLPERPYKIKAELALNPLTCLPARAHTHTHISVHLSEQGTLQYWSGRTDWHEQRDWNGYRSIFEYLTIHQIPLPPKAERGLPGLLPFMYHVFAFLNIPGLLLAGLKITKNCFHLFLWRRKLKYH